MIEHLPEHVKLSIPRALRDAYQTDSANLAERQLERLARALEKDHPGAAASLREGLTETLTVQRLNLTGALRRSCATTNPIQNLNAGIARYTRNVKRWNGGTMILRWVAAALLDAEQQFRRVRGFRDMPQLVAALDRHLNNSTNVAEVA